MAKILKVRMLGDLEFYLDERRLNDFAPRQSRLVFVYLLLRPGRHYDRLHLAAQFWPNLSDSRARKTLNTEIWRICSGLKAEGLDPHEIIDRQNGVIGVCHGAAYTSDVATVRAAYRGLDTLDPELCAGSEVMAIAEAVNLYRGDLLEDVLDDWCLLQRTDIRARHIQALEFLLRYSVSHQYWQAGLRYGQVLLRMDDLMEHIHRAVMRCHFMMGNRPGAMRQYASCQKILSDELGVCPMIQTEKLYHSIIARKYSAQPEAHRQTTEQRISL